MKIAILITRVLLGLIYLVFGLHFFLHFKFIPSAPMPAGKAGAFSMGLMGSGYFFQYMKVLEVLGGLLLIINFYTVLATLVLLPITLNIFLFHAFLEPAAVPMAAAMLLINLFLAFAYRKHYMGIFTMKPSA